MCAKRHVNATLWKMLHVGDQDNLLEFRRRGFEAVRVSSKTGICDPGRTRRSMATEKEITKVTRIAEFSRTEA